jgi:hypothetical protein
MEGACGVRLNADDEVGKIFRNARQVEADHADVVTALMNLLAVFLVNAEKAAAAQVFAIREGVNRRAGDINYDIKQLALECASKRMYPANAMRGRLRLITPMLLRPS